MRSQVESDIPEVKYHRKCCSLVTLKRGLNSKNKIIFCQLVQIFVQVIEILLHLNVENAKNCTFCQQTKRVKGAEAKRSLIAEEVAYHKSCYWDFTRIVTANKQGTEEENEGELDNSFDAVKDFTEVS